MRLETGMKITSRMRAFLVVLLVITLMMVTVYLGVRSWYFLTSSGSWADRIAAGFLLGAEGFILVHGVGYFLNIFHVIRTEKPCLKLSDPGTRPPLKSYPPVALVVASYKEPLSVIEDTLICFYNLTYPNKQLYLLDDTRYDLPRDDPEAMQRYRREVDALCARLGVNCFRRIWRGAKAGIINDYLAFSNGEDREGFEFTNNQGIVREEKPKYICVFDADMNPVPNFVENLLEPLEADPRLAFIQTPQYYTNFETNRVAHASGLLQAVFYEFICEGKSTQEAMFCCGTNVIFRREALNDVGGLEETSVTEDFATSLKFHKRGWGSAYINAVIAFGMGPEDLGAFFKQQFRWAQGTVGLFRDILIDFFKNPAQLPAAKWWEYFLSGSYYLIGWVFLILALCPVVYLFSGIPSFFGNPSVYLLVFVPYFALAMGTFIFTLRMRHYQFKDLMKGILLSAICFPVFMKASLLGLLGVKGSFGITPKGGRAELPLHSFWPQLLLMGLCFTGVIWGMNRLFYYGEPVGAILVNSGWALYHLLLLFSLFYFNSPEADRS